MPASAPDREGGNIVGGGGHEQQSSSLLQGWMAFASLSLIECTLPSRPIERHGCGMVSRRKLRNGYVPSTEFRWIGDTCNVGMFLLLRACAVVMALLLLIAGDVERNPGPTVKEGSYYNDPFLCSQQSGF